MPSKRKILEELTRERLLEFAGQFDITGMSGKSKADIVNVIASSKRARLRDFLPLLSRDELKGICRGLGLDEAGREKDLLINRILGENGETADGNGDDAPPALPPVAPAQEVTPTSPRKKALGKVEDYRHEEAKRKNIPPAKIAAEGTVPVLPKIEYSYSPRRPPVLRFDSSGDADKLPELLTEAKKRKLTDDEVRLLADALSTQEPWLEWAGKREMPGFAVDPLALHIHERVSAQAILKVAARQDAQRSLFADPEQEYHEAVQFYRHDIDWANRLILGDSLQVMASLARREDLAGKVQMIYTTRPTASSSPATSSPRLASAT
jgi:hypothetical protein